MDTTSDALLELGLTPNEVAVYLELLKFGLTNVGPIVDSTKLHRQLVYEALSRLESKQLVSCVIKSNRKHFQAASPEALVEISRRRDKKLREALPELLKLVENSQDRLEIRVMYGRESFFDNLVQLLQHASRADKVMRIIGGANASQVYQVLGNRRTSYIAEAQKLKVAKHLIAPDAGSEEFKSKFAIEPGAKLKTLRGGLSSPTFTRITPTLTSIEIYSAEVSVVQIFNRAVGASYREHFDLLWRSATLYRPSTMAKRTAIEAGSK